MTDPIWTRPLDPNDPADIHAAMVIFRQAYQDCWDEPFLRKALAKNHKGILAGSNDLACGCLVYRQFRKERDILGIGVLRDALQLGYGTALVEEVKQRMLRGKTPCTVVTYIPPSNEVGQRLFLKAGFHRAWTEPDYGGQGPLHVFRWSPRPPDEQDEPSSHSAQT